MSKLRDFAKGQGCVRCGKNDSTVVGCHYTGVRRLSYGGGFGIKSDDWLVAELCDTCHQHMDGEWRSLSAEPDEFKPWLHSEEFLHLIALTILRRAQRGVIKIT